MDSKKIASVPAAAAAVAGGGGVIPVKVAVRIRPISNKETEEGCQSVVSVVPDRPQILMSSVDKAFTFDFAFPANAPQKDVYHEAIEGMIPPLFEGYNATVLAYGQTGSGKTHSMGTSHGPDDDPEMAGIIQRAVQDLFKEIQARSDQIEVNVRVSFVELYREQLYDLLSVKSSKKEECICELREDPVKGVVIFNLTETSVNSLAATMHQLETGSHKRVTAATAMNHTSSRSHAIFTLFLDIVNKVDGGNSRVAKFHLVDLAGSERANKTKATGDRMKEGVAINRGLLALGNVISALGESNSGHVPYRDSKLTRMLQDSLGGNSYTLMLSCVSPADSNVEETIGTLRYADRARKIKNKPIVNLNGNGVEVNRLRMENQELRLQLLQGGVSASLGGGISSDEANDLRQENKRVKEENKELVKALVACQDEFAHMNEKMLLQDSSAEKLKTKFKEMMAEMDILIAKPGGGGKSELENFKKKISEVVEIQHNAEQTMMDHEISRADISQRIPADGENFDPDNDEENDGSGDDTTIDATHALKQNALATQLNELNKVLAQKEKLATAMYSNDEKLQEMKSKYEDNVKTMEKQISTMLKEKDELFQQHKNTPNNDPANKIAEQRRKRIQELEQMIADQRKKLTEQQRAIKVNEKNAAQVKKLADEIRGMKAQKVKLIRQIKEDAEKVRVWKQQKEKEVMKLKQQERKAQVKMAKMENLHSKQQNVLRRKMEEAVVLNKRLKDVVDKQKASRAANAGKVHGLTGAGDRMRNWINEQMEVVVSVKEATQSREELMNDRKTLTKQLNDIKKFNARNYD